jgi:hypothetical protein
MGAIVAIFDRDDRVLVDERTAVASYLERGEQSRRCKILELPRFDFENKLTHVRFLLSEFVRVVSDIFKSDSPAGIVSIEWASATPRRGAPVIAPGTSPSPIIVISSSTR